MRVPLLVRYPAAVAPATVDALALNVDVAPTLLDYAGVAAPPSMQGRSLRPLLEAAPAVAPAGWRDAFLYEFRMGALEQMASYVPSLRAVRTERWKLVRYETYPGWTELFDLRDDPWETRNLAADPPHAVVRAALEAWLARLERDPTAEALDPADADVLTTGPAMSASDG